MDYQKLYDDLINKARCESRAKVRGGAYFEAHHIVPRCVGGGGHVREWKTHSNIILLTAKEHFLAHYYLIKIYPENSKLTFAFWGMCNRANRYHERNYSEMLNFSEIYEEARIKASAALQGRPTSPETRAKISTARKGKKLSPEVKANMSTVRKGKKRGPQSLEHKANISQAKRGKPSPKKGRKLGPQSPEHIAKRQATRREKGVGLKSISQYTEDGMWIRDWDGVVMAERELLIKSVNIINCLKGKQKTAGGYVWKYA